MKPTTTLVIEGGGLRGAFSAGVAAELAAAGVPAFDDIIAVSSGAPTAAYLATGQAEDAVAIWRGYTHGTQLIAVRNLSRGRPLMDIDRLVGVFERVVPLDAQRLARSQSRLWVGVTDCRTGEARRIVATPRNIFELLRATMALPVANGRVIDVDGTLAIDGGVVAPIPLDHALDLRRDRTLLVLTRPRDYRRTTGAVAAWMIGWTYPRYPAVRRAMARHGDAANAVLDRIETLERARSIDVIRPSESLPLGRLSRDRAAIERTIAIGRAAARDWLRAHGEWMS
jgi:predicted patatin/cPLA2 family phospholipase